MIQDPGGAEQFELGGWSWPFWNDELGKLKLEELFASDALLLGRVTYQGFAEAWPERTDEQGFAQKMNELPKYVVSTQLSKTDWNNSHLIQDDIFEEITKLKQKEGKGILMSGSASLVRGLMAHNLLDELRLLVYPVVLGRGKKLFQDDSRLELRLKASKSFPSGVVELTYEVLHKN